MHFHLILASLLLSARRSSPAAPLPEEVPLAPIDFAALRDLSGRAPVEAPQPGYIETLIPLRRAA